MGRKKSSAITKAQIKKIWVLSRVAGLDEDGLRHLIEWIGGSPHLHDISKAASSALISELQRIAEAKKPMAAPREEAAPMFEDAMQVESPAQRALLLALARRVEWRVEGGFKKWIKSSFGLDAVRTNEDVTKVKFGLLSLIRQQGAKKRRGTKSTMTH